MMADEMTQKLMRTRADWYRLFSRLFILEVDEELFASMRGLAFPVLDGENDFSEGYVKLRAYFDAHDESDIINLEVDYARIFLAAGVAQGLAAFPYESVYTNKKHLMNQEASEDVAILYAAKGLEPREDMYKIPNDHIGLEFEYMATLCDEAAAAKKTGFAMERSKLFEKVVSPEQADEKDTFTESMKEQKAFCKNHMKRWMVMFCNDVIKYAETDFYKAVGMLCRGFVREEIALLS